LQDFGGVIVEDGSEEMARAGAVFGVVAEEGVRGARPEPGDLFGVDRR